GAPAVVPGEVAAPPRAPAGLAGDLGGGVSLGQGVVGAERVVVVAGFLLDARDGIERVRPLAAVRAAARHLAAQPQRGDVIVGIPPPAGGLAEGPGAVRTRIPRGEGEAERLGGS